MRVKQYRDASIYLEVFPYPILSSLSFILSNGTQMQLPALLMKSFPVPIETSFKIYPQSPRKFPLTPIIQVFSLAGEEGREEFLHSFQQLRSYNDEIETWNREEIPFLSQIVPRVFQLQKEHNQPSTMPHIYIATRPTRLCKSCGESKLQTNVWEAGILTTRPQQIP